MKNKKLEACRATNEGWICTKAKGHRGKHSARGTQNQLYKTWEQERKEKKP